MDGVDAAEDWLKTWLGRVDAQAARGVEQPRRVASLSGPQSAEEIMSVRRLAQAGLSWQVADEARVTVGGDAETGRTVIHSHDVRFPAPGYEAKL